MDTVLFDLDGTLLPLADERFTKAYMHSLSKTMAQYGFDPEQLVSAVWAGTKCMVQNDGGALNAERFWAEFGRLIPCDIEQTRARCDAFYTGAFDLLKSDALPSKLSAPMVRALKAKGYTVALATNPLFPMVAVATRLGWIDLSPQDFALCTSYENSRFCKPNLRYYQDVLQSLGKRPEDCLMVGNNVAEDMCFSQLGGDTYLVTDHMENKAGLPLEKYRQGTLAQLADYLGSLPALA